jgi:ABC-type transport system involved in multi-copper enzyme maturation permease subunit
MSDDYGTNYDNFYFGYLHSVAFILSRLLEELSLATTFYIFILFIFVSPLHVLVLAGHLQAEYTLIFRKLPH